MGRWWSKKSHRSPNPLLKSLVTLLQMTQYYPQKEQVSRHCNPECYAIFMPMHLHSGKIWIVHLKFQNSLFPSAPEELSLQGWARRCVLRTRGWQWLSACGCLGESARAHSGWRLAGCWRHCTPSLSSRCSHWRRMTTGLEWQSCVGEREREREREGREVESKPKLKYHIAMPVCKRRKHLHDSILHH